MSASPSPSGPERLAALAARATAADGQPPFSDQSLVELARGERELVEGRDGAAVVGSDPDGTVEFELVVDPDARGRGEGTALVTAVLAEHPDAVWAWAHGDHPASRALAARFGFEAVRTLLQLRAVVPTGGLDTPPPAALDRRVASAGLDTPAARALDQRVNFAGRVPPEARSAGRVPPEAVYRDPPRVTPFRPGTDDAEWLSLNARAFAHHPEQGSLTQRDLDDRRAEPWFDAGDFLVLREGDSDDGPMIGFCWLKVGFDTPPTPSEATQPTEVKAEVGEFYAVGIDPDRQGEGLGRVLMDAGFARLRERGIRAAALYVEADNAPALALYDRYGFAPHTIDIRYRRTP